MRLGVLGAVSTACTSIGPSSPLYVEYGCGSPTTAPGAPVPAPLTTTYGTNASGDTVVCPPGYPYDPSIQDCQGYIGSPADKARIMLQADIDACMSGGGTWVNGECVVPVTGPAQAPQQSGQFIQGVSNNVLYAGAGLLLLLAMLGGRK